MVEIRVARGDGPEEFLLVKVRDPQVREPLARQLEKHIRETVAELGELPTDF
jgi:hypothetical protein